LGTSGSSRPFGEKRDICINEACGELRHTRAQLAMKIFLLALLLPASATKTNAAANPIRKVVNMMEKMSDKIEEEGEQEKDLYDKFMCHCKDELADFNKGKASFEAAVPKLESEISVAEAQIAQLTQEIEAKKADEVATKESMQSASTEREKEHTVYVKDVSELKADIGVISEAIPALEQAGAFVQTGQSSTLSAQAERLQRVFAKRSASESERAALASLAAGKSEGIGEVKGMLEVQKDELQKEVSVDDKEETKEVNIFEELMNAKTEEKETIEETVAEKIDRLGALKVSLVEKKGELKDAQNALSKDFDVLQKLSQSCEAKTTEWGTREKSRGEELTAIQETVKILNSDENLGLFNKALPSPSFLQLTASRRTAMGMLKRYARGLGKEAVANRTKVDLVMLALNSKGVDFSSVMGMIDNMTALMEQEQKDDDEKKAYCKKQSFETKRKAKALRHKIQNLEQAVAMHEEAMEAAAAEIAELQAGVAQLDKSVAESTEMRKKEHEEFQKLVQEQSATKDVLLVAKNRLNQFYHPDMTTTQTTTGPYDLGLLQVHQQQPEFGSAKSVQGNGVLTMLEGLVTQTEKTVAEAKYNEKDSQQLYEDMLADAQAKREADIKAIASKQKSKASAETGKVQKSDAKKAEKEELKDVELYGSELQEDCSWLLSNYDARKTARAAEKETLESAKGALAGAQ
ncbi:unnamed protein product, partial [Effrenium voratum]